MERAAIFCTGGVLQAADLPADLRRDLDLPAVRLEPSQGFADEVDFRAAKAGAIDSFERSILSAALRRHNGNVSRAARALGLHRQNMQQKLRRLGISAASFKQV